MGRLAALLLQVIALQAVASCALAAPAAVPQEHGAVALKLPGAAKSVPLYAKSYALVIGIDNYTNGWPRLAGAIKDATTVAEVLKEQGFEVTLKKDLHRKSLTAALEEWFIFAGQEPDARLLVWFAGHGHTIERKGFAPNGYIVAADAPSPFSQSEPERLSAESHFKERALSLTRFGEFMKEANARHVLVVFELLLFRNDLPRNARRPSRRDLPLHHASRAPVRHVGNVGAEGKRRWPVPPPVHRRDHRARA